MALTEHDIRSIELKLAPLIGLKAWGVRLGHGSFLTLEFGAQMASAQGNDHPHGEWHLWVYFCGWYLSKGHELLTASEDDRARIAVQIAILDGLALTRIDVERPAFETRLTFDSDVILHLFPVYSEAYEHWMLYTPDQHVLTIGPGTNWSYAPSTDESEA